MKLRDIVDLMEASGTTTVYKVSSPNTDHVYYGYYGNLGAQKTFLAAARRNAADRTEAKFVSAAGGEDSLKFTDIEEFDSEYEAFMERNDLRAKDSDSISGPSNLPSGMFQRAMKEYPDRVKKWKLDADINQATARQAMNKELYGDACGYDFNSLKQLAGNDKKLKDQITKDLDSMLYPAFKKKYFS